MKDIGLTELQALLKLRRKLGDRLVEILVEVNDAVPENPRHTEWKKLTKTINSDMIYNTHHLFQVVDQLYEYAKSNSAEYQDTTDKQKWDKH